jgi:hypothetical protein
VAKHLDSTSTDVLTYAQVGAFGGTAPWHKLVTDVWALQEGVVTEADYRREMVQLDNWATEDLGHSVACKAKPPSWFK